jgi:putative glutamine amidotransferase
MRRPRIGLTLDLDRDGEYRLPRAYAEAVLAAGGLPLPLPYGDSAVAGAYLALCQGLVVTGGGFDIAPARYGEARRPACGPEKPARTEFEWALCEAALAGRIPLLGVCNGMQLIDVVRGGALHQDLEADLGLSGHRAGDGEPERRHPVQPVAGSVLARVVGGAALEVNSSHHQAVRSPGAGVLVSARAPDGVVEAIELPDLPFALGVQWHPERLLDDPRQLRLWRALVEAAQDLGR